MSAYRRGVPREDAPETRTLAVQPGIRGRVYRRRELGLLLRDDRAGAGRRFRTVRRVSDIYQVGHLERVPLGTLYPGIVAHVRRLLGKLPNAALIIDYTGVGRPVFDLFTSAGISPVGVLITGGAVETHGGPIYGVPKLTLVSRLQALLHEGRLKIHKQLSEAETLVRELQDFRVEFTAAGMTISCWRSPSPCGRRTAAGWPAPECLSSPASALPLSAFPRPSARAISSGSTSGKAATRRRSRWCGGSASPIRPQRRRLAENPSPSGHRAASNGSVSRTSERGGSQRRNGVSP